MSTVLQKQLDTYARSVSELDRAATRAARLTDDLIDVGLRLYESAQESVRRWHVDVARGAATYDPGEAGRFMNLYRTLDQAFDRIAVIAGEVATHGGDVTGLERLTRERAYLKAMLTATPEKAERAAEQVAAGHLKPAAEVRGELRRRLQP
jgi:hypothetical protein